jgi:hypothetical protein
VVIKAAGVEGASINLQRTLENFRIEGKLVGNGPEGFSQRGPGLNLATALSITVLKA